MASSSSADQQQSPWWAQTRPETPAKEPWWKVELPPETDPRVLKLMGEALSPKDQARLRQFEMSHPGSAKTLKREPTVADRAQSLPTVAGTAGMMLGGPMGAAVAGGAGEMGRAWLSGEEPTPAGIGGQALLQGAASVPAGVTGMFARRFAGTPVKGRLVASTTGGQPTVVTPPSVTPAPPMRPPMPRAAARLIGNPALSVSPATAKKASELAPNLDAMVRSWLLTQLGGR